MTRNPNTPPPSGGSERECLIGRVEEIAAAQQALARGARLLTLIGPTGVGKTRLARALAGSLAAPVFFVDLSEARSGTEVLGTVARACRLPLSGSDREEAERAIAGRLGGAFVILDNVEQVIEDTARLVGRWLDAGPMRFIVTSRERLRIAGEHAQVVPPLSVEHAVELFVARARSHDATLDGSIAADARVRRIVGRLDCLPLALELAAAQLPVLSLDDLEGALDRGIDLLRAHHRDAEPRHISLRDTIDLSLSRLEACQRRAIGRLGVVLGSFEVGAAAAILEVGDREASDLVRALVDRSLIAALPAPHGERRFRLYESIRERALERAADLGELEPARAAHARYYVALAERCERAFGTPEGPDALATAGEELDNVLAAQAWLRGHDRALAARAGLATFRVIHERALHPAYTAVFEHALEDAEAVGDPLLLARAHWSCVVVRAMATSAAQQLEGFALALAHAERAGDADLLVRARMSMGVALAELERRDEARESSEKALELARQIGDRRQQANALHNLGSLALDAGDTARALELVERSLTLKREAGNPQEDAAGLLVLGLARHARGEGELARALYARATEGEAGRRHRLMAEVLELSLTMGDEPARVAARLRALDADALEAGLPVVRGMGLAVQAGMRLREGDRQGALRTALEAQSLLEPRSGYRDFVRPLLRALDVPSPSSDSAFEQIGRQWVGSPPTLSIGPGAEWVTVGGGMRIDLRRRTAMRLILLRLVEQARAAPGVPLDVWALVEAGWPGERILATAAPQRVYSTLDRLRRLGLAPHVERRAEGWLIVSEVKVERGELPDP